MSEMYLSPSNPNAEQGGGDLCNPHKQIEDVQGPWVVFPAVDVAEHAGILALPHASLPLSRLREAVALCEGVSPVDTPTGRDIRDELARGRDADAEFTDLSEAEQQAYQAKWPGHVVQSPIGYVQVPGISDEVSIDPDPEPEFEPRQQVPAGSGEYVDVDDDEVLEV